VLEVRAVLDQLTVAGHQNADNLLKRFVHLLAPNTALGGISMQLLPTVDFASWYAAAVGSMGASQGSGDLDFPMDSRERVAMQLQLLRHVADDEQGIRGFGYMFLSGNYDDRARGFAVQIVVSFFNDWVRIITPVLQDEEAAAAAPPDPAPTEAAPNRRAGLAPYVNPDRISELRSLRGAGFDFTKLTQMCEELNRCWEHRCYLAVGMLARSLLNHVAPVFGVRTFAEVASNVAGTKSFKESTTYLENGARKIADASLHNPIRAKEALPSPTQVDFSRELDVVLEEIVRKLKN
jgi:hypothetical protein